MPIDTITNRAKKEILDGTTPLTTGSDLRMVLLVGAGVAGLTAATVQDLNFLSELDAIVGVDFHSERVPLTGEAVVEDDALNRAVFAAANVVFAAAPGVTADGAAVYREAATDATRVLISVHTTGFPQPVDGGLSVLQPVGLLRGS